LEGGGSLGIYNEVLIPFHGLQGLVGLGHTCPISDGGFTLPLLTSLEPNLASLVFFQHQVDSFFRAFTLPPAWNVLLQALSCFFILKFLAQMSTSVERPSLMEAPPRALSPHLLTLLFISIFSWLVSYLVWLF
jgi:hypothetical protein